MDDPGFLRIMMQCDTEREKSYPCQRAEYRHAKPEPSGPVQRRERNSRQHDRLRATPCGGRLQAQGICWKGRLWDGIPEVDSHGPRVGALSVLEMPGPQPMPNDHVSHFSPTLCVRS